MRIAINAVAVSGGGGQTYLLNILTALCHVSTAHEYLVFLTTRQHELAPRMPCETRVLVCRGVPGQGGLRMAWEQAALPLLLRREKVDLLYAAYNTAVILSPVPVVLLAHNPDPYACVPISRSMYARARNVILRRLGRLSAQTAHTVVFVSDTSARVMAPKMGVDPRRVRVVHHGWLPIRDSDAKQSPPPSDLPERYVLTVADLYPHKNLEILLEAFQNLVVKWGYSGHLVIAGAKRGVGSWYEQHLLDFRDKLVCRHRIHFVGTIPHPRLFAVYKGADLFVFPSMVETFGLPLVEAMALGLPVVVSDWRLAPGGETGQFNVGPEICGEAAEFFNPLDPNSLVYAMHRVLASRERHEELARLGQIRSQSFSWEESAGKLLSIFEEAGACRRMQG